MVGVCAGYLTIRATRVTCVEFSQCNDDVGICLWTNGSLLTQSAAEAACQQRGNSFLPRVTNNVTQSKLADFRIAAQWNGEALLGTNGFWIDVKAVAVTSLHWIDGTSYTRIINVHYLCFVVTR